MASPVIKGFFFSILCFGLLYWYLGILNDYFLQIFGTMLASAKGDTSDVNSSHMMGNLLWSYIVGYIRVVKILVFIILGAYILSIIKEKIGKRTFQILILLIMFFTIWIMIFLHKSDYYFELSLVYTLIGIIFILLNTYFLFNKKRNENIDLLLISSISIMIINPIGSDGGLWKSVYGMWLILPLTLLCIYQIKTDIKNMRILSILSLVTILLISLLCVSIFFHITCTYRDDENRLNLNTEFSNPSLKGVYSTSSRVKVVDELIYQIKENSDKNDKILLVNNIPVFYYLTETKPSFGEPWPELKSLDEVKEKQQELENKKELPKLFIYSKVDTEGRGWPDSSFNKVDPSTDEIFRYLKTRYVNSLGYSLMWENKAFVIYGRPPAQNIKGEKL